MGLLSALTGSTFDPLVDKATSEENTSEDWALIMDICDRVVVEATGAKDCIRSVIRRLNSPMPMVVMQSLTLIDALVNNCGKKVHLEVCSRDFETELRRLVTKSQPKISERARQLIKKWAKDFKSDPQLSLMPALYQKLKSEGVSFKNTEPKRTRPSEAALKNPDAVGSAQEEADILKAIEMSLRDSQKGGGGASSKGSGAPSYISTAATTNNKSSSNGAANASLYPSFNLQASDTLAKSNATQQQPVQHVPAKEPLKVRALYDFEAAEDNELTFKSGELILVSDSSDANWWKGSNHRGEGLFPANFVSTDLTAEPEPVFKHEKRVQFNEEIKVKLLDNSDDSHQLPETNGVPAPPAPVVTEIDESRIDRLLHLLHEADPQAEKCDSEELLSLEEQCVAMMPMIDQQIELIDKRHASLSALNTQLNSALNLYHDLMKESLMMDQAAAAAAAAYAQQLQMVQQHQQQPQQPSAYATYQQHPGMVAQIAQPQPYDPNIVPGQQQQQQFNSIGVIPGGAQYYAQAGIPPTMAYQTPPQSQQQMSYAAATTAPPTQQVNMVSQMTNGTQQQQSQHQPSPHQSQPQQSVPSMQQQQQPSGAYHPMYQSPSHQSIAPQQQQPQTPVGPVISSQYQSPSVQQYSNSPYTPDHQQQIVSHHHMNNNTPTMSQQQPQQPQQMIASPPHHGHMMMPHGTSPSGGMINAVPNLL